MDAALAELKAEWQKQKRVGGGRRPIFSEQMRRAGQEYAQQQIKIGATKAAIARDLGVSETTVWRWAHPGELATDQLKAGIAFKAVRVVAEQEHRRTAMTVSLVTPRGYRIEGLDLASAALLLRELG
jgi:transposase-like protein